MLDHVDALIRLKRNGQDLAWMVGAEGDEPGPCARIMINGMPAMIRFQPPCMRIESSRTRGSVCSST
jgi:hypothetical protein